ncbi:MAG TPA: hypothetical protein VN999_08990, partial [Thermoanaerobaculia bacterium]|nr:hypothetical protein [Thermoanaerobaculia bacterium]
KANTCAAQALRHSGMATSWFSVRENHAARRSLGQMRASWPLPLMSTIDYAAGQTRANNAILGLARDGSGSFVVLNESLGTVQLMLDVNGYFQ